MNRLLYTKIACACLALLVGMAAPTQAALLTVTNFSFETPNVGGDGGFDSNPPSTIITGWNILSGQGGVLDPNSAAYTGAGATNGVQVAYSNGGTISQILSSNLALNTLYTLAVDVGSRKDFPSPGYSIQLLAGGNVIGTSLLPPPVINTFVTATVSFFSGLSNPNAGSALEIRLISNGVQTNFDNVRLDASPQVPEPVSLCIWAGFGLIAAGGAYRRRRMTAA
jgi:hypothetical protein